MNKPRRHSPVVLFAANLLLFVPIICQAETPVPCESEPTDQNIRYGDFLSGADCAIAPSGDSDLFRFNGKIGEKLQIFATDQTNFNSRVICATLYDPDGVPTPNGGQVCANITAAIYETLEKQGTYTVVIRESDNDTMSYGLALERIAPPTLGATPVCFGCNVNGAIDAGGDLDLYIVNGSAGDVITITATDRTNFNSRVICATLYDPDGTPTANGAQTCANITASINETLVTDGFHSIRVRESDNDTMSYSINLQCIIGTCEDVELSGIGVYRPSQRRFYLDMDGSLGWNAGDLISSPFGIAADVPVIGDWNADRYSEIGVFRPSNRRFYVDIDGSDSWNTGDTVSAPFGTAGDIAIIGDWNGDGVDTIGVFRPSNRRFYLDVDGSESWNSGDTATPPFGLSGDTPVIGDWNRDGIDEIGVFRPSNRRFYLDLDGSDDWNFGDVTSSAFGNAGDIPVTGDWNRDGIDEIGVFRPSARRFYLDLDGSESWTSGDVTSSPFGNTGDVPVIGVW